MITLRLDKNGGINKGDVQAFEHDNLSEVYIIQLYKNGAIYDLTNKSIELTMVERKRKIGDMVSLPIYEATEGKVKLEVVSDITKQDGIYDFKLTVKDTTGLIETFPNFQVKIKNDITDSITGEIIQDPNFTILTDGLKALADYNIYKTNALKVPEIEQDIVEINEQLYNIVTQKNKLGVDISDKMFNTKPNDETFSNSDGIRKAIKYAVDYNINAIFIPSGVWYIDVMKPIFIPNNFTVYGVGKSSIIKAIKSTYDNISLDDFNNKGLNSLICCGDIATYNFNKTVSDKNITIKDLVTDGNVTESISKINSSTNYFDNGFGILLNYGGNFIIENVEVKNTLGTGILFDRNYNTIVNNCIIHDCGKFGANGSSRNGISFVGINDVSKKGCIISNSVVYNNGDIGVQYAYTPITISNNHIYGNTTFNIEGDSAYTSTETSENNRGDINIINNYITDSQIGITISNVNNQKVNIIGNIIKRLTKTPIFVSQTTGASVIINNNNIANINIATLNENCIYVKADVINISNNNISYFSNPSNNCISIDVCKNVIINSNIIYSCYTNKMINVRSKNATIINNVLECLTDKSTKGINVRGSEFKKLIIKNNTFENIYRECISSEFETINANVFDISNNIFNNSSEGQCNCVNIVADGSSTINTLFFNGNYCNKDEVVQMLRFLVVNSTFTVKNYFGIGNYFNSALGSIGGNLYFVNVPTSKVEVNNVV